MVQHLINARSIRRIQSISSDNAFVKEVTLLALITLVGALLRFYKLGEWSFWGDEVFTIGAKEDGFNFSIWRRSLATDLIRWATQVYGATEWNARIIPALIGIISIPILYFLIKRAINRPAALIFAIYLALSTWHLYWSQNARFYILLLLFYSCGLLAFYIGLEEDRPAWIVASLILFGMAARERLLAVFSVPTILCYLLLLMTPFFEKPRGLRWRNMILFFSPIILVGGIFVAPYLGNLREWMHGFGRINSNPAWIVTSTSFYISLPVICLGTFATIHSILKKERTALYFFLGGVIPLLGTAVLATFHYAANRYAFVSLSSWLILAALASRELFSRLGAQARFLSLGVVAVVVVGFLGDDFLYYNYHNGNRPNWKAAASFIQSHELPGDMILCSEPDVLNYYLEEATFSLQTLKRVLVSGRADRIWLVVDLNAPELFPEQVDWARANATQVANYDVQVHARLFPMEVYLYEPVPR